MSLDPVKSIKTTDTLLLHRSHRHSLKQRFPWPCASSGEREGEEREKEREKEDLTKRTMEEEAREEVVGVVVGGVVVEVVVVVECPRRNGKPFIGCATEVTRLTSIFQLFTAHVFCRCHQGHQQHHGYGQRRFRFH